MIIPYKLETTFNRVPYMNVAIIVITSIIFFMPDQILSASELEDFVLRDWSASGLIGNLFLHGDFFHLFGNMLFLWIFGNAICAAAGDIPYGFMYLLLGIIAGSVHLIADGHPAIGASGAINGIVGMTLVMFPKNKLHVWYWFWIMGAGKYEIRVYWMILYWFAFDIFGSFSSPDGIAHWAHLGGFAGGVLVAILALKSNLIETSHHTIFDALAGRDERDDRIRATELEQQLTPVVVGSGYMMPQIENINQESAIETTAPAPPPIPVPTVPDIQLKKCVGGGASLTLYVVNNGAPMISPTLRVPQSVKAQMSPTTIFRRGETGSIRFNTDNIPIDSIEFIIAYSDSAKTPQKIRLKCVPAAATLEVVSASSI